VSASCAAILHEGGVIFEFVVTFVQHQNVGIIDRWNEGMDLLLAVKERMRIPK
jgi:hypothetical protein